MTVADWTRGGAGLAFQRCPTCDAAWYFERRFCPRCGASEPDTRASAGAGAVVAVTVVHRAPSDEWRALGPYTIVLVDLDEGVRVMGQADAGVGIGERVTARFEERAGRMVPVFGRARATARAPG